MIVCIKKNSTRNNSNDNGNVNTNNNDNKSQYEQGGKKSKDTEWNKTGQNLKINNYDPTLLPTHLPTMLSHFKSSWKTVI